MCMVWTRMYGTMYMRRCVRVWEETCTGGRGRNNNKSYKLIRLGRYGWGRNMCQEACHKAVGRATCMCVCMCTTHTGKRNSRVFVAAGSARRGGGVSQPTSSREFAWSSLRIKLGDSGGDNVSKGDSNDSRNRTVSDADNNDVAWRV